MGLGLAIIVLLSIGVVLGFMVIQAMFAARKWRSVISEGDHGALMELLDQTFDAWRSARPPKGTPPADWRALHTAALTAADHSRIRVSIDFSVRGFINTGEIGHVRLAVATTRGDAGNEADQHFKLFRYRAFIENCLV